MYSCKRSVEQIPEGRKYLNISKDLGLGVHNYAKNKVVSKFS